MNNKRIADASYMSAATTPPLKHPCRTRQRCRTYVAWNSILTLRLTRESPPPMTFVSIFNNRFRTVHIVFPHDSPILMQYGMFAVNFNFFTTFSCDRFWTARTGDTGNDRGAIEFDAIAAYAFLFRSLTGFCLSLVDDEPNESPTASPSIYRNNSQQKRLSN